MPTYRGCEAWLESDGIKLQEFGSEVENASEQCKVAACWIASEAGKRFVLHWSTGTILAPNELIKVHITIDETKLPRRYFSASGSYEGPRVSGNARRALVFASSASGEERSDKLGGSGIAEPGNIFIEFYKLKTCETDIEPFGFSPSLQTKPEWKTNNTLKCSHYVKLGDKIPAEPLPKTCKKAVPVDPDNTGPFARFRFKYAPREHLEAIGIISKSPTQANSEASNVNVALSSSRAISAAFQTPSKKRSLVATRNDEEAEGERRRQKRRPSDSNSHSDSWTMVDSTPSTLSLSSFVSDSASEESLLNSIGRQRRSVTPDPNDSTCSSPAGSGAQCEDVRDAGVPVLSADLGRIIPILEAPSLPPSDCMTDKTKREPVHRDVVGDSDESTTSSCLDDFEKSIFAFESMTLRASDTIKAVNLDADKVESRLQNLQAHTLLLHEIAEELRDGLGRDSTRALVSRLEKTINRLRGDMLEIANFTWTITIADSDAGKTRSSGATIVLKSLRDVVSELQSHLVAAHGMMPELRKCLREYQMA